MPKLTKLRLSMPHKACRAGRHRLWLRHRRAPGGDQSHLPTVDRALGVKILGPPASSYVASRVHCCRDVTSMYKYALDLNQLRACVGAAMRIITERDHASWGVTYIAEGTLITFGVCPKPYEHSSQLEKTIEAFAEDAATGIYQAHVNHGVLDVGRIVWFGHDTNVRMLRQKYDYRCIGLVYTDETWIECQILSRHGAEPTHALWLHAASCSLQALIRVPLVDGK